MTSEFKSKPTKPLVREVVQSFSHNSLLKKSTQFSVGFKPMMMEPMTPRINNTPANLATNCATFRLARTLDPERRILLELAKTRKDPGLKKT